MTFVGCNVVQIYQLEDNWQLTPKFSGSTATLKKVSPGMKKYYSYDYLIIDIIMFKLNSYKSAYLCIRFDIDQFLNYKNMCRTSGNICKFSLLMLHLLIIALLIFLCFKKICIFMKNKTIEALKKLQRGCSIVNWKGNTSH